MSLRSYGRLYGLLLCAFLIAKLEASTCSIRSVKGMDDASKMIHFLNFVGGLLNDAKKMAENSLADQREADRKPMDCAEVYRCGQNSSGAYRIWPRSRVLNGPVDVYCDMEDDGGGWTVFQRRGDFDSKQDYFYQDWNSYKSGFGDINKDFWIGNDALFALTNQRMNTLKFDLRDFEGNATYATYDEFWVDDEEHKYTLHVKGYRGTAGDSFSSHNGDPFTTKDKDNDKHENNCAVMFKGAWWYNSCHSSNLNGNYLRGKHESHADGVEWHDFRGHYYSLKDTVMKIRPKNFRKELGMKK